MKKIFIVSSFLVLIIAFSACKKEQPQPSESVPQSKEVDQTAQLTGLINGKYRVTMSLKCEGERVTGTYYYHSQGSHNTLNLNGVLDGNGNMEIHETNNQGQPTGHFDGVYGKSHGYQGTFVNYKGQQMSFKIDVENVQDAAGDGEGRGFLYDYVGERAIPTPQVSNASSYGGSVSGSSSSRGSSDVDAMLDSYDRYVTNYISYARKAADGDMTAIAEYTKLAREAEELSRRIEACEGDMSSAQLARYQRITMRMAQAAQDY
ncbi:MAG: hypothetical protein IKX36_07600 [Prevotella sp.]|nr:hypothetical protein [Prevotella sp.]